MPVLIQTCVVVATLAFAAMAAATIVALIRLGESATKLAAAAQDSMAQVERTVHEAHDLLDSMRALMPPAQRVVWRFQALGERAADLSTAALDEIEVPLLTAVAVARGLRAGTSRLLELLTQRFTRSPISNNGDQSHE
jgi:uncharacterized protein YoxC